MRIIIFGGAGYLGSRLAMYMDSIGHEIVLADRVAPGLLGESMREFKYIYIGEEGYQAKIDDAISQCDTVMNLAAMRQRAAEKEPLEGLHIPVDINYRLISAMGKIKPGANFIYMSSIHVYGTMEGELHESMPARPGGLYGLGKRLGEDVVDYCRKKFGVRAISARLANGFGYPLDPVFCDWDTVVNDIALQAVKTNHIKLMSSGEQERNFITLQDAARALEFLAGRAQFWPDDGLINIGSPSNRSIVDMALMITEQIQIMRGYRPKISRPAHKPGLIDKPFKYNIDRLKGMGFAWEQDFTGEIDRLIRNVDLII